MFLLITKSTLYQALLMHDDVHPAEVEELGLCEVRSVRKQCSHMLPIGRRRHYCRFHHFSSSTPTVFSPAYPHPARPAVAHSQKTKPSRKHLPRALLQAALACEPVSTQVRAGLMDNHNKRSTKGDA